ncbi:hypothetical protein EI555_016093, partial [Monodon monoceros]
PRGPKSSSTSVYLFTDFDSHAKVPQVTEPPTVLHRRTMDSKGGRPLAWSSNKSTSKQGYSSSGSPCDAKLVEKNFATDMNLNFPNLSVIGLCILSC